MSTESTLSQIPVVTLANIRGCRARLSALGASLLSLEVPDRWGQPVDVVLGYEHPEDYLEDTLFLGCTAGRYSGRISRGQITVDGQCHQLARGHDRHQLHGGPGGFHRQLWRLLGSTPEEAVFAYTSPDGDQGFPGAMHVEVRYRLEKDNTLAIRYLAHTEQTTVVNLTNHSYFNLAGHSAGSALDQELQICSDKIAELDAEAIPTGRMLAVVDTPMDFLRPRIVGDRIDEGYQQLQLAGGYDHAWIFPGGNDQLVGSVARLYSRASGISLDLYTDQTSLQFYSGNHLPSDWRGKGGVRYGRRSGLCLETQHLPDSPNQPTFPTTELRQGERYCSDTLFRFRAEERCLDIQR